MNSPVAWALVFHVIGLVFWMAGLLVVTQVMAFHAQEKSSEVRLLGRLETRLLNGMAHPGALITITAGIVVVALQPGYLRQHWLHAKLSLVVILLGMNVFLHQRARALREGTSEAQSGQFRMLHGVVSALFLGIVILVMIKPF